MTKERATNTAQQAANERGEDMVIYQVRNGEWMFARQSYYREYIATGQVYHRDVQVIPPTTGGYWTRCSCGHIAQDHNLELKGGGHACDLCMCRKYDGHREVSN